MKPWQLKQNVEQMAIEIPEVVGVSTRRGLAGCWQLAPESGLKLCMRGFPSGSWCQRLLGHPGGHSIKPERCNRPAGHEGPHAFIVAKDARKLGEW